MGRVLLLVLLWALQLTIVLLLVGAPWIEHSIRVEGAWVAEEFGESNAQGLEQRAEGRFRTWFVSRHWVEQSYRRLLPDPTVPKLGMEGLAPWFFAWLKSRITAGWWLVYGALFRLAILQAWQVYLAVTWMACAVDGLVSRAVKKRTHGYSSGDRYTIARGVLLLLFAAVPIYLFLPVPVAPLAIPIWGGACAVAIVVLTSHAQQKI
jgi:hypothetical protein